MLEARKVDLGALSLANCVDKEMKTLVIDDGREAIPTPGLQRVVQRRRSMHKARTADTRLFTGHDYRPNRREARWESTIASQRMHNPHLKDCDEAKFVKLRTDRDRNLPMPNLMLSALWVNITGGRLPTPEDDAPVT